METEGHQPENITASRETAVEQEDPQPMRIIFFGKNNPVNRAMVQVTEMLSTAQCELASETSDLLEASRPGSVDAVLMIDIGQESIRAITRLRNDPEVKQQPVVIAADMPLVHAGGMNRQQREAALKQMNEAGADVVMELPLTRELLALLQRLPSIPALLAGIEDSYGDKMIKNKTGFYQKFREKLYERSALTADTGKEVRIIDEILSRHHSHRVLDAGGGEGRIGSPLADKGYEVINLDVTAGLLEQAATRDERLKNIAGDLRQLPLENESVDATMFNWHVFCDIMGSKAKRAVLAEAHRVIRPDGVIILDIPDRERADDEKAATEIPSREHKMKFRKDGVYISGVPGEPDIFIGYVPAEKEMATFMEEAGFRDIQATRWQTKKGFSKLTLVGRKKSRHREA